MRHLLTICALLLTFSAGAEEGISFDGKRYALARVAAQAGDTTNDYLLPGDTPAKWQTSLGVRLFKGDASLEAATERYVKELGGALMDDPQTLPRDGTKNDVVLVLFLTTPDKNTYEYALQRFVRTGEGVVAYRFAERFPQNAELSAMLKHQSRRIEQLFALKVPVKSHM